MYGTDWPVHQEVSADFGHVFGFVDRYVSEYIEEIGADKDAWNDVFYQNAVCFYGLKTKN